MAEITVTFEEAIKALEKEQLKEGEEYQYGDLSEMLKKHFPKINVNQISGIVTKLSRGRTAIFNTRKEEGFRQKYILKPKTVNEVEEKNEVRQNSVRHQIIENIRDSIFSIQNIPFKDIQDQNDFKMIKDSEIALTEIIKKLQ